MKLSSFIVGTICGLAVIAVVLMLFGVLSFHRPVTLQGAALYDSRNEVVATGSVASVDEFTCPVGENEIGGHLILTTAREDLLIHLAPGRVMRSQSFSFVAGDKLQVVGAKFRFRGQNGVIAREITRGNETFVLRDHEGKLLVTQ